MSEIMNRAFLSILLGLALTGSGWAQTADFYENDGIITCPPDIAPQIDAFNFVNVGVFSIDFTNITPNTILFTTASTLNFTNRGFMSSNQGFEFDTAPTTAGQKRMAASYYNSGIINAGASSNFAQIGTNFFVLGLPKLIVSATNLVNPGTNIMGFDSVCSFRGQNVDFSRATLMVQNTGIQVAGTNVIQIAGQFDGYWGLDTNLINPAINFEFTVPPFTPRHLVTNRNYNLFFQQWNNQNGLSYISDQTDSTGSNRYVRVVFLINTNVDVNTRVFFPPTQFGEDIAVEWAAPLTNGASGSVSTNFLYLFDTYGIFTNQQVLPNGNSGVGFLPTYIPANFFFLQGGPLFLGPDTPSGPIPGGTFPSLGLTNESAAYQALFLPSTQVLGDVAGQDVTNLPGRVEIVADNVLDLSFARIASANYLEVRATNHFVGSPRAQISSPFAVLNLRSTNGLLTVTNLMSPFLSRPEGTIDCYATRFTNFVGGITNEFHVLFLNSRYTGHSPSRVEDLILHSTNTVGGTDSILISDMMTVTRSLLLDTANLTITTNEPGSPTPTGGIIVTDPGIVWSTDTPRLQNLTNYGLIEAVSSIFFGGSRSSPFYSSNYNQPYQSFINRGTVTNSGSLIWANTFVNSGTFFSAIGDVQLQQAENALLTNGAFLAPNGNNYIASDNLYVSNHVLLSGAALTLAITNILDDGSLTNGSVQALTLMTNKNTWSAKGINLVNPPAAGSLLATTITNFNPTYANIGNLWSAKDWGVPTDPRVPIGFTNNSAIGRLILIGQDTDSAFTFTGTGANNALYVDLIEFRGSLLTNRDNAGNFVGIQVDPNMKIYYGQAIANGVSVAEKLSGKNGGGFLWASNYAGFYSGTNVVYPDGTTNRLNTALVTSCDIDSDGDGIVNCQDPDPVNIPNQVFRAANIAMAVGLDSPSSSVAHISWNTIPYSTNYLYASSSTVMTNCQVVTNFVVGPVGGRVTVSDVVRTNEPRFYRARVDPPYQ
jgi:hypothetical protein